VQLTDALFKLGDLPFKTRNAIRRKKNKRSLFSDSITQSDSEVTFYQSAVQGIIRNNKQFSRFRRIYDYREILEHVDYRLGLQYLSKIQSIDPNAIQSYENFKVNDFLGKPRLFKYPGIGKTNPTTLRYVSVAVEIQSIFKKQEIDTVVEIGAGYGGQALILDQLSHFSKYHIFDLPEVQTLIGKYLSYFELEGVSYPNLFEIEALQSDLIISNYAFSELPRHLQELYLERVLKKAKNGFLLMNSGGRNSTGRSDGKLTVDELRKVLPRIQILAETPLTGPDNYLIIWESAS